MVDRMEFNTQLSYILFIRNLSLGRYFFDFEPLVGDMGADAESILLEMWIKATEFAIYDIQIERVRSLFCEEEDYQNARVYFDNWIEMKRPGRLLTDILLTFKADFSTIVGSEICVVYDQVPANWPAYLVEPRMKIVSVSELLI